MTRILPSIGRIVWFFPAIDGGRHEDGQPFSSMIAGVNDDGTINLLAAARDGTPYGVTNVLLVQEGDEFDQDKPHAVWMPFQKGQAAKTEAAQAAAVDLAPVHERIDELAKTLEDGGPIHQLFAQNQDEIVAIVERKFAELEAKLGQKPEEAAPAQDNQQGNEGSADAPQTA